MKQTISENEFIKAFDDMNRSNNFSIEGRRALFNYLEEIEDYELDVIAICCEYSEYENIEEYLGEYQNTEIKLEDYDNDRDDFKNAILEEINDKTMLIKIDDESFIIQQY